MNGRRIPGILADACARVLEAGVRRRPRFRYPCRTAPVRQCDMTVGTIIESSMSRVAPPTMNSRRRLWP